MKKLFSFAPLTLLCFGLWLWSLACSSTEQSPADALSQYTIATENYAVLAEKAITYQADFDWDAWSSMLADDVQYQPFNETVPIVGKPRVLTYWKKVIAQHQISTIRLAEFTSIPLHTPIPLYKSGPKGIYVYTICRSEVLCRGGHQQRRQWVIHTHFNNRKMIDRLYTYSNQVCELSE